MLNILEIGDCLFNANKILFAESDGNDVVVTVAGMPDEVTVSDCTLSRFKEAWVGALKYGA